MKKFQILLILGFAMIGFCLSDCKKNDDEGTVDAIVKNEGDPATDGCGYVLIIGANNQTYHPDNLSAKYQIDNLHLKIKYHLAGHNYSCGIPVPQTAGMPVIVLDKVTQSWGQ